VAVQRFLPDVDRTRRAAGIIFLAVFGLLASLVCWAAIVFGRVTVTTIVFVVIPAALAALGARFAFVRDVVIDVDPDQRRYSVLRRGKPAASGSLEDLGPLEVSQRTRLSGTGNNRRTVTEYVVSAAVHSKIELYVLDTPAKARRKAEALARAWRLPCRSLGGAVRAAKDLDVPLHERLRDDREAMAAATLRPEWGIRIEPVFRGHSVVSTHRSYGPLVQGAFFLLVPILVLIGSGPEGVISAVLEMGGDVLERVLAALMAIVMLVVSWKMWEGVRDTFFPGRVEVNDRGVTYRGRRMRFADIEEVIAGVPIEIIGDRRALSLSTSFCPPAAMGAVAHEIQRLIIEVGPRAGA
jgi:hypothetical protein